MLLKIKSFQISILCLTGLSIVGFCGITKAFIANPVQGFNTGLGFENISTAIDDFSIDTAGRIIITSSQQSSYGNNLAHGIVRIGINGSYDGSFNPGGVGLDGYVDKLLQSPEGIYIGNPGGTTNWYNGKPISGLIRITNGGILDTTFQVSPSTFTGMDFTALTRQSDGKILTAVNYYDSSLGRTRYYLKRINGDGTIDTSFIQSEFTAPSLNGITTLIQSSDGGIIIAGSFTGIRINNILTPIPQIIKLQGNGTIDNTFSIGSGVLYTSCTTTQTPTIKSVIEDASGNILIGGSFNAIRTTLGIQMRTALIRVTSTGSIDSTFSPNSWQGCTVSIESIIRENDGRILIGGNSSLTSYNGLPTGPIFRFTSTGIYDGSFQTTLTGATGYSVKKMILQSDGKILVTGTIDSSARIVRFNTDGSRDYSLTENEVHTFAYGFEMDADFDGNGNTLVVGDFGRYNGQTATGIVRIRSNGQLDGTFNTGTGFQWGSAAGIRVEDDGNILVFGSFNNLNYRGNTLSGCIVRLDSGGNLIDNFTNNELGISYCGTSFGTYNPLQIQDDGKIIIAGLGGGIDGQNDLIRVTKSGTIDTIFDTSGYTSFNIKSYQITPDYGVTIFGDFEMIVNGNTITHHILRFLPNGLRDYTINIAAFKNNTSEGSVEGGIVDGSGNIVVSGYFTTYGGNPTPKGIVSINGSGVYNSNFSYTTSAPTQGITIRNLSLFSDNTINFTERSDIPFFSLSVKRITETGNIDSSLQTGTGIYGLARRIYEAPTGNILILGMMQTYLGNSGSYHHSILALESKPGALDLIDSSDTGNSQTDNLTRNVFPIFSGTGCFYQDVITLHIDSSEAIVGTSNCNQNGTYQISPSTALIDGSYTFMSRFRSDGNVSNYSYPLRVIIDSSASNFTFTSGSILTNNPTPQITGIGESGSTILLTVNGNVYTTNVIGGGTWSLTISNPLIDGTYTTTAYQTDIGGTVSAPINNILIVDSTPPSAPIVSYPPNNITLGNANPYFAGTTESGAIIRATINGYSYQTTLSGDVITWNFQATNPLSNGANTVTIRSQDQAGNISTGTTLTINLDPSIGDAPIVIYPGQGETLNINTPTILGIGGSGDPSLVTIGILDSIEYPVSESLTGWQFTPGQLSEGIHTLVIQQKDTEGNILSQRLGNFNIDTIAPVSPALTSPSNKTITKSGYTAYEVSGTCENDTTILITGTMNGNSNCNNSIWKYLFNFTSIPDGTVSVQISGKDAAGNISTGTTYSFVKDITSPTITLSPIYTPASNTLSNDGQVLAILVDASESLSGLSLSSFQTSSGITMKNISLVNGWTSRWMVDISPTSGSGFEGTLQVNIPANTVNDGNGNPNIASNIFTYQIDTLAPNIPGITSITKGLSNTVNITGTGQTNMKIFVFDVNNSPLCSSNVTPSGTWGCSFYYIGGSQTIKVIQQDLSNNVSSPLTYTFDLSGDGPTFSLTPNIDQSKIITGSVTISIQPSVPLMNPLTQTGISIVNGTLTSLSQSGNTYTAIITRGNTSSGILSFQIIANAVTDFGGRKNLASEKLTWYHQSSSLAATQTGAKGVANLATDINYSDAGNGVINIGISFSNHSDTLLEKGILTIQLDEKIIFGSGNSSQGVGIYNAVKHTYTVDLGRIYPYTYGMVNLGTTLNSEVVIERGELSTTASIAGYDATGRSGLEADGSDNSKTKRYSFTPTNITASYLSGTYVYSGNTSNSIENINRCTLEKKVEKERILATDISNHWAKQNIEMLIEYWIVKNLSLFRPEDKITRAEFITLIVRSLRCSYSLEELEESRSTFFRDVPPNAWYSNYIGLAEKNSWVPSDIISYFRPDDSITRAEAISMVISALGATDTSQSTGFSDIGGLSEYQQNLILTAQSLGIVNGVTGGGKTYFLPGNKLSRAEGAKMIQRAFLQNTLEEE